mgnify:CR=1 FL=1
MKIGKIKPAATLVAQFAAGVEVDAIQHEGKMFLPVVGMGDFESTGGKVEDDSVEEVPAKKPAKKTPAKETKSEAKEDEETREYTEDELMEMSAKELTNILKKEFEIDPNDYDGKNTNKKLRGLILDAQADGGKSDDDEDGSDEEEETSDDLTNKVADLLEDFDSGAKNKKKTIAAICKLTDDADEDAVADLVDKFEDDADADIDKMAAKIAKALGGSEDDSSDDDDEEEEEKPKKKSPKSKKTKKEDLVDVDDLEVGDRVSVWWDDDNQEWFDGEVSSIKKGKVTIAYDDDTEEVIDPEVHTKIKRID